MTLKYLRRLNTPIVIFNLDGFYDSLLLFMDDLVKHGAVIKDVYELFDVVTSVNDEKVVSALNGVKNYKDNM